MMSQKYSSSSFPLLAAVSFVVVVLGGAWNYHGWTRTREENSLTSSSTKRKNNKKKRPKGRLPTKHQDAKILHPFIIPARRGGGGGQADIILKNRIIRAAAFGGSKLDELIRTHTEVARGGVAMTTVAYASVSHDGRSFDSQILLTSPNNKDLMEELEQLTRAVQEAGAKISIQLTHGGFFADRHVTGVQQVAPSPCFNPAGMNWAKEMTTQDFERISQDFVNSAILAEQSGFDAIELHCGHGYLLSQFLSPSTNWRKDEYGGNAMNRLRFPLEILKKIRQATTKLMVLVKMNLHDGFSPPEGGMTKEDAITYAKEFAQYADVLVLSGGFTSRNGFFMLRGRVPLWEMAQAMGWGIKGLAVLLFGKWLVPEIPFEECFFYEPALEILHAIVSDTSTTTSTCPICLVGGITSLSSMEGLMDDGFSLVQMARGLIQNPHLVNDIEEALLLSSDTAAAAAARPAAATTTTESDMEDIRSTCIHCNQCVVTTLNPKMEMNCPVKV